jgi:hypothetical protein
MIGARTGAEQRSNQVQQGAMLPISRPSSEWRYIAELEDAGFVTRIERRAPHRGKISNEYDLSGLVSRLRALEPEFREVEEKVKAQRSAVARPGMRTRGGNT